MTDPDTPLSWPAVAGAARPLGWGLVLGNLVSMVAAESSADAVRIAAMAVEAAGPDADAHLRIDVRADLCELRLRAIGAGRSGRALELAAAITDRLAAAGRTTVVNAGIRPVQMLEICVDAMDIPAVRPFWRAILGYQDTLLADDLTVADPLGIGPSVWFQQMDTPRQQRNRIHFDIVVTEDEADQRIADTLAAGGRMVSDSEARAFWILADVEGNEVCVCTWQDRD